MLKTLWNILRSSDTLIEEAGDECLYMLDTGREMFQIVSRGLKEKAKKQELRDISRMDKAINRQQRDVRKKVFEHLAVSRGSDLITGLQLTSVVIDLERIGDYTKNIAEIVQMMPAKADFGQYEETYNDIHKKTLKMFDLVRQAFAKGSESKAREALSIYDEVSKKCDGVVSEVFKGEASGDSIPKRYLALVLLMRYMKRVNAHLKNIATSIINPVHMIGFRPGAT
jgi:phosphate transport system protein